MQDQGGEILAISTEKTEQLPKNRAANPYLPCVLACDPDGTAASKLLLLHQGMGKIGKKLFVPANILLDKNGVVVWAHYAKTVMDREHPQKVLTKVKTLGPKV